MYISLEYKSKFWAKIWSGLVTEKQFIMFCVSCSVMDVSTKFVLGITEEN